MADHELLRALKEQLAFFESGGYGYPYRSAWRPTLLIRDSPLCLKAVFAGARPCRECALFALAPAEKRNSLIPCHHITLNDAGDTIARLYETGTPDSLDRAFHDWLCATIQRLEQREETTMKTLEISTGISFKNILYLTDFTEASEGAYSYALAFARKYGARLYPAHVIEPFLTGELDTPLTPEILKNVEDQKRRELASLFKSTGVNSKELVAEGAVENIVPAWVTEHGIDLIVIGTHGRKGVDRFFLGSTAETIFRKATCPVLTVGPKVKTGSTAEFKVKKILFATSLTREDEHAITYALSFAQERNAELMVLHVVSDDIEVDPDPRVATELAWKKLRKLAPVDEGRVQKPELFVAEGEPARRILEHAQREQPDLIVLGLSKEEKTSTHFQRGIAYKVVSLAPCAVLTVR